MDEQLESIYCGLAFGGISLNFRGGITPCCAISPDFFQKETYDHTKTIDENINNSKKIKELRSSLARGIWHPACALCKNNENSGGESMRTIWNKFIPNAPITKNINYSNIKWLSISIGNKCNSKCMTCGPQLSDFWIEESIYIYKKFEGKFNIPIVDHKITTDMFLTPNNNNEIIKLFNKVEYISFIGGEPTILDEHLELLQLFIDNKLSSNITLSYVTNLSSINNSLIDKWKNFKGVNTALSLDGYGIVNDYIRYPLKFEKAALNLSKYINLLEYNNSSITISITVSIFNIIHVCDLINFLVDIVIERKIELFTIFLVKVRHPEWYNLNLLSVEYRQKNIEKIKILKEKIYNKQLNSSFISSCLLLESWCNEPQNNDSLLIKKALHYITNSDLYRKRHIKDFLPELWEELISLENNGK